MGSVGGRRTRGAGSNSSRPHLNDSSCRPRRASRPSPATSSPAPPNARGNFSISISRARKAECSGSADRPGCGKTHFLDYVIALQRRAGALDAQNARRLVCGLELAGRITGVEVELFLLSVLAEQIGGDQRSGDLFRQMRGAAALNVALETARRTGITAVTVAIDFGTSDCEAGGFFRDAGPGCRGIPPGKVHRDRGQSRGGAAMRRVRCWSRRMTRTRKRLSQSGARGDWWRTPNSTLTTRTRESIPRDWRPTRSSRSIRRHSRRFEQSPAVQFRMAPTPIAPRSCLCRAWRGKCWRRQPSIVPATNCRRG